MIWIEKKPTPEAKKSLTDFLRKEGKKAHFGHFKQSDGKGEVQISLAKEQFYLCAYCMRRIPTSEKIEHWHSQEASKEGENPNETLDYNNMLAVCKGITHWQNNTIEHCDQSRSKSNKVLTINPLKKESIEQLKYLRNGRIYSDNKDMNDDLNNKTVLNLNNLSLQDERKKQYEAVKKLIDIRCRGKSEAAAQTEIRKIVDQFQKPVYNAQKERLELPEFCGIVRYFFDRSR
jgi:uncharacterized protein (TIGR02646 family)